MDFTCLEHKPAVAGEGDDIIERARGGHGGSNGRRNRFVQSTRACRAELPTPDLPDTHALRRVQPQLVLLAHLKRVVELVEVAHNLVAPELSR